MNRTANASAHPLPARSIFRIQQVTDATGFTRAWIYRLMAKGEFPKNHKIGRRAVGWSSHAVESWIAEKMGERA